MKGKYTTGICLLGVLVAGLANLGQVSDKSQRREEHPQRIAKQRPPKNTASQLAILPELASRVRLSMVLGRPTDKSMTINVLSADGLEGYFEYGITSGNYLHKTGITVFSAGNPVEVVLSPLQPDTQCFYRLRYRKPGDALFVEGEEHSFHTQRASGTPFIFTITADSHLDNHTNLALYKRTLASALSDTPDFHIDLGDTFMTEKYKNRATASYQYLAQRYCFDQLCQSVPLFLVLGNHDGESPRGRGSDSDGLAVWANMMRKRYFPNPVPDNFYSGNTAKHPELGCLQDYYAWEWGDALFVTLDPYWFMQKQRGQNDNWKRSLGLEQYQWLKRTLETSRATFKCIFIHHLVGGRDDQGRGGVEAAPFFEWGGKNVDGSDGFTLNRLDWTVPIHQLLVQNHVSIVFHGHDHLYAKQDLDGIVYQEVPQPGNPDNSRSSRFASEYGYHDGIILGGSGYLRVTVTPKSLTVDYISVNTPQDVTGGQTDRKINHTYTITDRTNRNR